MKKPIVFILALLLALSMLAGCGGGTAASPATEPTASAVPEAANAPAERSFTQGRTI